MPFTIERLRQLTPPDLDALAEVLVDCVEGGASVSFMQPFSRERAAAWWRRIGDEAARGDRALVVAREAGGRIIGTVQLVLAQPENQPHRADLSKLLVHRRARRQGIGEALMHAADAEAVAEGRTLLVLDTAGGGAERLYARLGWVSIGRIPGYALLPDGAPCDTEVFYRQLPRPTADASTPPTTRAAARIEHAAEAHLAGIAAIYNDAVRHTTAIWNDAEVDVANRRAWWQQRQALRYPVLVALDDAGAVLGYASFGDFRAFDGYRHTVENSVYVRADARGRGLGEALLARLVSEARALGKHLMVAAIENGNAASIALHARLGFRDGGVLPEAGVKFGRWLDLRFMSLKLDDGPAR